MNKILVKKSKKKSLDKKSLSLKQWQIFGLSLFGGTKTEVLKIMADFLALKEKRKWIATVNPEFVMEATKDRHFYEILQKTDLNVVDGVGLIWAKDLDLRSSIVDRRSLVNRLFLGIKIGLGVLQGKYRNQISSGSDLIDDLCKLALEKRYKVFFLGGFEDRAKKTEEYFKNKYKSLQTESCEGRPKFENKEVIEKINKFKPDILFVAYAMKKQEIWISENLKNLDVGIAMGVGRSLDYYSGSLKRAPMMWRKMGLEWLYSLIKEPKRWRRQLVLPRFVWKVLKGN
jgi:N-acetylglucosaminyldiphosphoundecaprenol N-acetyl-beta-D-mannosaminyltransferase